MCDIIKTTVKRGSAEIVEKKSRFIANVCPVKTEEEAKSFIDSIKKQHYNARHNVFAYQIGEKNEIKRFSDDGEPQGTAGMPVLNVLAGGDIKNTIIVVTRYFGGTLLGTGGLVRAYTEAAKAGLENAGIYEIGLYKKIEVCVDYTLNGKVQYEISKGGYFVEDTEFTDKVKFILFIENSNVEKFKKLISDITSGRALIDESSAIRGTCSEDGFKTYE